MYYIIIYYFYSLLLLEKLNKNKQSFQQTNKHISFNLIKLNSYFHKSDRASFHSNKFSIFANKTLFDFFCSSFQMKK